MFPKLEGLDSLARRDGVDIRPTLVRVLTDLYVQKPAHSAEEERHYTELALRLINSVDLATRVTIAKKLGAYAGAPPAVARRLARDVIEVAEPILRHSRVLTAADLDGDRARFRCEPRGDHRRAARTALRSLATPARPHATPAAHVAQDQRAEIPKSGSPTCSSPPTRPRAACC